MKVITYNEYGAYYVPKEIIVRYYDINYYDLTDDIEWEACKIERHDPKLVELFEKYKYSDFKINEIPNDSYYKIFNYDGAETLFYSESEIHEV